MTTLKPLLLHICCAPDEAWVVKNLKETFDLHCFFCNPNITPIEEYNLRCKEASTVAEIYKVKFSTDQYTPSAWEETIQEVAHTSEGGERCKRCFFLRLKRTAEFGSAMGYRDFTTVMSVSPHKNITIINEIGMLVAKEYNITYHCFDFKKNDGFRKSVLLSKELGLYRQDYCGCRLSKSEAEERKRNTTTRNVKKITGSQ
jgi:predicted adenine nucleotide alpha hydrolase (AANH) superfamily ATPase